jgi:argininosuccinate lyase
MSVGGCRNRRERLDARPRYNGPAPWFEGLVANSIEGVANWDHVAEFAFANAVFLAGVSRLALEIQRWSTDEYQMAELDSPSTNSIKPQKENQDALECGRKVALATMGPLVSILTSLKGREYQYSSPRFEPDPKSIDAMIAATHMLTDFVRSLQLNREQMSREAEEKIATMTDLIDMLVRRRGIGFHEAHEIIARLVGMTIERGIETNCLDLALVQEAVVAQTGQEISVTAHDIAHALDPMRNIRRFDGKRMPAPESIQASVNDAREAIKCDRAWLNDTIMALAVSKVFAATASSESGIRQS